MISQVARGIIENSRVITAALTEDKKARNITVKHYFPLYFPAQQIRIIVSDPRMDPKLGKCVHLTAFWGRHKVCMPCR